MGGSQGSLFINQTIYQFIAQTNQQADLNLQIIHQTGNQDLTNSQDFYRTNKIPAIVFSYETNLMPYYKCADLIICRSGAGTLAEILPLKTRCITIPLETIYTSHQLENALENAREHAWVHVLKQAEITHDFQAFSNLVNKTINC